MAALRVKKEDGLVVMESLKVQEFMSGTCIRQTYFWSPGTNFSSLDINDS